MIWVMEWSHPIDCDSNVTLWNTQVEAQAAACADIMDDIQHNWDLTEADENLRAQSISDECAAMNFEIAIDLYNDWMSSADKDMQQFYQVYDRSIQTQKSVIRLLSGSKVAPSVPTIPAPPPTVPSVFKATKPGATCRGPCQNYNEHAYADKPDGTHVCYQCKMMSQVFGGKVP